MSYVANKVQTLHQKMIKEAFIGSALGAVGRGLFGLGRTAVKHPGKTLGGAFMGTHIASETASTARKMKGATPGVQTFYHGMGR